MSLYLLRFDPDLQAAARWFHAEKLAPRNQDDDGYAWHALLAAAFGPALAPKPFRLLARRGRPAQLLAYAAQDAAALTDHASYLGSKIAFLLDATLGLINLEQNQIIKIFSIAAVCLMPPTLVAFAVCPVASVAL